jgi:hypothetical protein
MHKEYTKTSIEKGYNRIRWSRSKKQGKNKVASPRKKAETDTPGKKKQPVTTKSNTILKYK